MLGKTMLTTDFAYNAARNERILACAAQCTDEQLDTVSDYGIGSLRATLWHTLIVEYGWRMRCQGVDVRQQSPSVEPTATVAALQAFQQEDAERARVYLASLSEDDLVGTFTASRPNGETATFVRWQVLQHILYHSAQHRSEAATLLTQYGQSPGDLDFIYYITRGPDAR